MRSPEELTKVAIDVVDAAMKHTRAEAHGLLAHLSRDEYVTVTAVVAGGLMNLTQLMQEMQAHLEEGTD